jgi:hypothetical protein
MQCRFSIENAENIIEISFPNQFNTIRFFFKFQDFVFWIFWFCFSFLLVPTALKYHFWFFCVALNKLDTSWPRTIFHILKILRVLVSQESLCIISFFVILYENFLSI